MAEDKKETIICPSCEHENLASAEICVICDYPLAKNIEEIQAHAAETDEESPEDIISRKTKNKQLTLPETDEWVDKKQQAGRVVKCRECGEMNRIGTYFCEECGAPLDANTKEKLTEKSTENEDVEDFFSYDEQDIHLDQDVEHHMESSDEASTQLLEDPTNDIPQGCVKFTSWMVLRLDVAGHNLPIFINPVQDKPIVIGRKHESLSVQPNIDLTPYLIKKHGVSRRHAVIRLHDTRLELIDLDSKNGTNINDVRFFPKARHQLRHQDWIKIGRIQIQVSFISEEEQTPSGQTEELS